MANSAGYYIGLGIIMLIVKMCESSQFISFTNPLHAYVHTSIVETFCLILLSTLILLYFYLQVHCHDLGDAQLRGKGMMRKGNNAMMDCDEFT